MSLLQYLDHEPPLASEYADASAAGSAVARSAAAGFPEVLGPDGAAHGLRLTLAVVAFDPATLTPAAWWDASRLTGLNDGDPCGQFTDFSGNGIHGTAAGSARATYKTNVLNGLPVLRFDGVGNYYDTGVESLGSTGLFCDGAETFTVFAVFNVSTQLAGHNADVFSRGQPGATTTFRFFNSAGSGYPAVRLRGSTTNTGAAWNGAGYHVAGLRWDGAAADFRADGQLDPSTSLSVGAAAEESGQRIIIGAAANGTSGQFTDDIAELIVFDYALSTAQRQQVEGYLAWKWGLQANLPAGHPYELAAPVATDTGHLVTASVGPQADLAVGWWQYLDPDTTADDGAEVTLFEDDAAGSFAVSMVYTTAAGGWRLRVADSAGSSDDTLNLAAGRWQHLAAMVHQHASAGTRRAWVDGNLSISASGLSNAGTVSALKVGVPSASGTLDGAVDVDQVRIATAAADAMPPATAPSSANPCAERTLIVTRRDSADSEAWGDYYRAARGIPRANWCRVPCSGTETLADYATFQGEVETPLADWLATNAAVAANVTAIVLGYNVPGAFAVSGSNYSAASRLSRLGSARSSQADNPLAGSDVGGWPEAASAAAAARITRDAIDAAGGGLAWLVARIDAPDLATAEALVDRAILLHPSPAAGGGDDLVLAGAGFLDPYGLQGGAYESYEDLLESWGRSLYAQRLKQTIEKTAESDPGENLAFDELAGDDWYFGWHSTTGSADFFGAQGVGARALFYDGDSYAATTLRSVGTSRWCPLAIAAGYALTAGPTDEPTSVELLSPWTLFECLRQGMTWIEAFYRTSPRLDGFQTCIGDPLAVVSFPLGGYHLYRGADSSDQIDYDTLIAAAPAAATQLAMPAYGGPSWPADSRWFLALRPVNADGVEYADPSAIREVNIDEAGQLKSRTAGLVRTFAVEPAGEVGLIARWRYEPPDAASAAENFEIFIGPADGQSEDELLAAEPAATVPVASPSAIYEWPSGPLSADATYRVAVRPISSDANVLPGEAVFAVARPRISRAVPVSQLTSEVR